MDIGSDSVRTEQDWCAPSATAAARADVILQTGTDSRRCRFASWRCRRSRCTARCPRAMRTHFRVGFPPPNGRAKSRSHRDGRALCRSEAESRVLRRYAFPSSRRTRTGLDDVGPTTRVLGRKSDRDATRCGRARMEGIEVASAALPTPGTRAARPRALAVYSSSRVRVMLTPLRSSSATRIARHVVAHVHVQ